MFLHNFGWFQLFLKVYLSLESERDIKKWVLVTKSEKFFAFLQVFFYTFTQTRLVGRKVMQRKQFLKITKFVGIYLNRHQDLLKTGMGYYSAF